MTQVLNAALANLRTSIETTRATITHDALPMMTVDAARMSQVFQNFVGNAIKYRKPDECPRIHVSARRERTECWVFTVQDNGMGFDNAYSDQIFRMFKRLHGSEIAGTGIGLAICKKIVESPAVRSGRHPLQVSDQPSFHALRSSEFVAERSASGRSLREREPVETKRSR